jgi:hypothetical protein
MQNISLAQAALGNCTSICFGIPVNTLCSVGFNVTTCAQACLDPTVFFFNKKYFLACSLLPLYGGYNLSQSIINMTRGDYVADATMKLSNSTNLFNSCMSDYCRRPDTSLGGCPFTDLTSEQYLDWIFDSVVKGVENKDIVTTVNPDIGGIGV